MIQQQVFSIKKTVRRVFKFSSGISEIIPTLLTFNTNSVKMCNLFELTLKRTVWWIQQKIKKNMPKRKRPLERPRHRQEDNINMDLEEVEREGMDWTDLAQDRNKLRAFVKNFVGTQKQDDGNGCLLQPAGCTKKQRGGRGDTEADEISCAKKTEVKTIQIRPEWHRVSANTNKYLTLFVIQ
jgi:hypothetical protein